MFKSLNDIFKDKVNLDKPFDSELTSDIYLSFAMQRSGQHLIIDWMCKGFTEITHLNHCRFYRKGLSFTLTPMVGRTSVYSKGFVDDSGKIGRANYHKYINSRSVVTDRLLYTVEDMPHTSKFFKLLRSQESINTIFILRDPANWLASSIAHGRHSFSRLRDNIGVYKSYIREALKANTLSISYNDFITSLEYRKKLAEELGLISFEHAELALTSTPDFGGGSSFSNLDNSGFFTRWEKYRHDDRFLTLIDDNELIYLSKLYFNDLPGPF